VKKDYSKYWEEWEKSDQQNSKNMKLSDDFKDIMFKMISYSYTDRPSIKEIKNHKWFQQRLPSLEHVKLEIMKIKLEQVSNTIVEQVKSKLSEEFFNTPNEAIEETKFISY
jgi:serine/threonine protein kinase